MSETAVQTHVRLEASRLGSTLFRNNSGACYDRDGRLIRFGLGNDSAKLNKRVKSSDLIGFTELSITPNMVGQTVAIFTAFECKDYDFKGVPRNEREIAQERFIRLVRQNGGIAGFVSNVSDVYMLLGEYVK